MLSHVPLTALLITNGDADLYIRMRRRNSLTSAMSGNWSGSGSTIECLLPAGRPPASAGRPRRGLLWPAAPAAYARNAHGCLAPTGPSVSSSGPRSAGGCATAGGRRPGPGWGSPPPRSAQAYCMSLPGSPSGAGDRDPCMISYRQSSPGRPPQRETFCNAGHVRSLPPKPSPLTSCVRRLLRWPPAQHRDDARASTRLH